MKTRRSVAPAAFFTALVLACVRAACAQPVSISTSSVEWAAANSQMIVRAVIEDVSLHKFKSGLHRGTGIRAFHTISVRVLETLKGDATDRLQFVHTRSFGHLKFQKAKESKQEVLLFLDHWSRNRHFKRASGAYAYTRFPLVVEHVAVLKPDSSHWAHTDVPILSSDLTRLSNSKRLLIAIRSYLDSRKDNGPVRRKTIQLPPELRGGFYRVDFTLPVDRAAEIPVLEFEEFKKKYAKPKPEDKKLSSYDRSKGGYVGVDSLELMATDCDVIVRGVVEDSCFLGTDSSPTLNVFGVNLRVLETLKGECAKHIGVYMSYPPDLDQLQRDRQELVVFLRSRRLSKPAAALGYQTRDGLWDDSVIVLDDQKAEVLFADMTWHRQPKEILDRVRNVVNREHKKLNAGDDSSAPFAHHGTRPPVFWFHPPTSLVAGSVIAGNVYSRVYLPVDKELEANARKWASSKNQDRRWLAARAMIYFKSKENAAILKKMRDDDATWGRTDLSYMMENLSYPHEPKYLVRWEAWHVLTGWGYDVPIWRFGERRQATR